MRPVEHYEVVEVVEADATNPRMAYRCWGCGDTKTFYFDTVIHKDGCDIAFGEKTQCQTQ